VETLYTVGLLAGLGAALGVFAAGLIGGISRGAVAAALVGAIAGGALGIALFDWAEAGAGVVGGLLGGWAASGVVAGTLRRGGTRGGTAALVTGAALVLGLLALIPVVGYLEAVALPVISARLRRRTGETYAGLRTLARD